MIKFTDILIEGNDEKVLKSFMKKNRTEFIKIVVRHMGGSPEDAKDIMKDKDDDIIKDVIRHLAGKPMPFVIKDLKKVIK
jgi:hypothetical protein